MFVDDMIRSINGTDADALRTEISKAVFVKIQTVVEFYYDSPQDGWHLRDDFPKVVSPWPTAFFQWRVPPNCRIDGTTVVSSLCPRVPQGALIQCWDVPSQEYLEQMLRPANIRPGDIPHDIRWFLAIAVFLNNLGTRADYLYCLDSSGQIKMIPTATGGFYLPKTLNWGQWQPPAMTGMTQEQEQKAAETILESIETMQVRPVLLALSLAHCKNVTYISEPVSPALQKKRAKRGLVPVAKFYTLDISPMRQALSEEMRTSETSLARSMHICRGHFKEFTED